MYHPLSKLKFLMDLNWDNLERQRHHTKAAQLTQQILHQVDRDAFRERFIRFWNPLPGNGWGKYLNIETWMLENATRYYIARINRQSPPADILDLGCGCGYFLRVCQQAGHRPMGLDMAGTPFYDEMIEFFGLERVLHQIQPLQPLPDLGRKFDVITGFQTCFNFLPNGDPWQPEHWRFFLEDVRRQLKPSGRLFFQFNYMKDSRKSLPEEVKELIRSTTGFKSKLFYIYGSIETTKG